MTVRHNGRGRSYAVCDEENCEANVIGLSGNLIDADRVVNTFFGWKSLPGGRHQCAGHSPVVKKRNSKKCESAEKFHSSSWRRASPEELER